jgi:hypothetical protein
MEFFEIPITEQHVYETLRSQIEPEHDEIIAARPVPVDPAEVAEPAHTLRPSV